jgi:hypothetical protein
MGEHERQIDALLAEHIMDMETCHNSPSRECPAGKWFERKKGNHPGNGGWKPLRHYITWTGIGLITDAMMAKGFIYWSVGEVTRDHVKPVIATVHSKNDLWMVHGDSAPMAVALAALKALGVEVPVNG